MKNFVQPGDVITIPAPTGGVVSGGVVIAGELAGVAAYSADANADVEVKLVGVFELPKASADDIALGAAVYWDETEVTLTATNNDLIGHAARAAGAGVTSVEVRLKG